MGIASYIKEIGRGREGARALSREQAQDLMGQILDAQVSDLELGAFCLAMRIKGETAQEMAGFLDAAEARIKPMPGAQGPAVILPSYNGARRLPLLTPLLALLLAREGAPVLIHGTPTEGGRVSVDLVLQSLDILPGPPSQRVEAGKVHFVPTSELSPALVRLLEVRRVVGLRNSAHSMVKLMQPLPTPALLVSSYTHPEYAQSMAEVMQLRGTSGMLLRGTEGEAVADPRRAPATQTFLRGERISRVEAQAGTVSMPLWLPEGHDVQATAAYTRAVLRGATPVPAPIGQQVAQILRLFAQL